MTSVPIYAQLAARVYAAQRANRTEIPTGWNELEWIPDRWNGFSAGVFRNPFQAWDFDPNTFTGSSTTATAKSFTVYLNQAAKEGATLVLHLGALAGKGLKAVLGDQEVAAEGATLTLAEGQTQASFALIQSQALESGVTGALTVSYQAEGESASSNAWSLTWAADNEANDTLEGGAGRDILNGGGGSDTYVHTRGMGQDTIVENDATPGRIDVAQFASDIAANQLWLRQVGNDLQVSVIGTQDVSIFLNWYGGSQHQVEQFRSGDGKLLASTQVDILVQAMAAYEPPAQAVPIELLGVIAATWH